MGVTFGARVKKAWDAFRNARDPTRFERGDWDWRMSTTSARPDRQVYTKGVERTIIASIYNRISTDVSQVNIRHVKLDDSDRYSETVRDGLNNCLSTEANVDQTGRAMIHDAVSSMLDEGCVAIVPVYTDKDPEGTDSYDVLSLRVGKILEWRPYEVKVDIYNEETGGHDQIWVGKKYTAIVENPFYSVMNEQNSTLQRLVKKLNLLDKIDNIVGSNKFDLIIQLPYLTRVDSKKKQASERRQEIENQLNNAQLGVAYIDAAEKVIQLNRPLENTLLGQIEFLTKQVYAQLGIDETILNGTAEERVMTNYNNRVIDPILLAITEEMDRKFLSKTARSQGHKVMYFTDPFRLLPISSVPEVSDKLTRNEIMSSNEIRQVIGLRPSKDPKADELRNKNLNKANAEISSKGGVNTEAIIDEILKRLDGVGNTNNDKTKIQNEEEYM